jgi:aryl-alcohol dehydrogenase-like predicted oxidoreductase
MEQPQYNMLHRDRVEREYARLYDEIGLGTTIWSPLASGLLTGKYDDGCPPNTRASHPGLEWLRDELVGETGAENREKARRLIPVAEGIGCTRAQLALAWCLKNQNVSTVITGASKAEQVEENMAALEVADRLTPEVMETIEGILDNKPKAAPNYR